MPSESRHDYYRCDHHNRNFTDYGATISMVAIVYTMLVGTVALSVRHIELAALYLISSTGATAAEWGGLALQPLAASHCNSWLHPTRRT